MDNMDEVFTKILTKKDVNNTEQNLVDRWMREAIERHIDYDDEISFVDIMDEVFTKILTKKDVNNTEQNLVDRWMCEAIERHIDYDDEISFDDWYVDAYKDFANWFSTSIWNDEFEINSNLIIIYLQDENNTHTKTFKRAMEDIKSFIDIHKLFKYANDL